MKVRQLILAGIYVNLLAVGATAETTVVTRPMPCQSAAGSFLLGANSGALIRIDEAGSSASAIIVYRPMKKHGWASQRILARFDLELEDEGVRVVNSGLRCEEGS